MKKYREKLIRENGDDFKLIKQSTDFYSLSSFRDLLFHVKEHTFNIPKINDYITRLNLKFCGFENRELISYFKDKHIQKEDIYNLELWNSFELKNPRIFAGMYQFWCQKL